jgi:predicted metal-dependent hydrolase
MVERAASGVKPLPRGPKVGEDAGMGAPPEPQLEEDERRQFERGVDEFNRGFYFECHDTIEDLWAGLRGPSRDFFQGLIQVSVAFYHLGNGNLAGAESMTRRALKRFERYPERYFGFDLAAQRDALHVLLERIAQGEEAGAASAGPPRWTFDTLD